MDTAWLRRRREKGVSFWEWVFVLLFTVSQCRLLLFWICILVFSIRMSLFSHFIVMFELAFVLYIS